MRAESRRLIWPAPTPSVMPPAQNTIALLFTYFATFQANSRSSQLLGVGLPASSPPSASAGVELVVVGGLDQQPRADALDVVRVAAVLPGGAARRQRRSAARARSPWPRTPPAPRRVNAGAISTSTNCLATASARRRVDLAVEGDDAAEGRGRVGLAAPWRRPRRARPPIATPHGLACLTITQARRVGVEALHAFPGRVGIGDVVVRELLALQLPRVTSEPGAGCRSR